MPEQPKCPTCHSNISVDGTHRTQGQDGVDENGKPIPRWSDDPVLTSRGFSGDTYTGRNDPRVTHILELQADRAQLEIDSGVEPTEFSDIEDDNRHIRKLHIIELRESTEKILDANGLTLDDYFNKDENGNPVTPGPNDPEKTDWTDVARGVSYLKKDGTFTSSFTLPSGEEKDSPSFPNATRVRAIHIEDLRHAIVTGWREFWSISSGTVKLPDDHAGFTGFSSLANTDGSLARSYEGQATAIFHQDSAVIGHPEYTDSHDATQTISVINPDYEENPPSGTFRAFPTTFDIHPTDAGNRYLYIPAFGGPELVAYPEAGTDPVKPEKTWIVDGNCISDEKSHIRHILYTPNPIIIDGALVAQPTKLNFIETGTYIAGQSSSEANIIALSEGNVALLKPTAKTLQLKVNGQVTILPVLTDSSVLSSPSTIEVSHIWSLVQGGDPIFGYPIPDDTTGQGNKDIFIRKDTHFKFHAVTSGSGTGGVNPFITSTAGAGTPKGTANGFVLLQFLVGGNTQFIQIRFAQAGPGSQTYNAPFGGQSFTYDPAKGFVLGIGPTYDEAININDLMAVASLPAVLNFSYTNHKMIDPETSDVIENPSGTLVQFIFVKFRLDGVAYGVTPSVVQTGFESDGKPIYDFTGVGGGPAVVAAEIKLNAIRIENNNRRIQDIIP